MDVYSFDIPWSINSSLSGTDDFCELLWIFISIKNDINPYLGSGARFAQLLNCKFSIVWFHYFYFTAPDGVGARMIPNRKNIKLLIRLPLM